MLAQPDVIFPPFRLEATSGRLWRATECLPIRPKSLAVLRYLIEHRDRVVGIDELAQVIWPGRFGAESAPKQCILELRKQLGDSSRQPRFIETVGRFGYRFIGAIETYQERYANSKSMVSAGPDRIAQSLCVGREDVLAHIQRSWDDARAGRPRLVLLLGPDGIGKTTVAETFITHVGDTDRCWMARGQCVEQRDQGEAYLCLLDALGALACGHWRTRLIDTLERHAPFWLFQLPALIPPGGESALQQRIQGADRSRMLRELVEALEALARDEPGLLLLEDLQWADRATLDWLNGWTLRRGTARLLILCTWRTGDRSMRPGEDDSPAQRLDEWGRRPAVIMLPLTELDSSAVESYLMARFADYALTVRLTPVFERRCGGQPFLMNAMIEDWLGAGSLAPVAGRWQLKRDPWLLAATVPRGARELVRRRLEALAHEERQTLEAASVIGMEFTTTLVASVAESDRDTQELRCAALAGSDGLLTHLGLVPEPSHGVANRYTFRNALYRDVIYERLSATRRFLLHRRIDRSARAIAAERNGELSGMPGAEWGND